MQKTIFICPYFGDLPSWFSVFLESCKWNRNFQWLIPSDHSFDGNLPSNVRMIDFSLSKLNQKASNISGLNIAKNAYSQCDLRPLYGHIFSGELRGFDFWGHCDLDVIWGDLSNIFPDEVLEKYEIISSQKEMISGHCTLYKNTEKVNQLFHKIPDRKALLENSESCVVDEKAWSDFLKGQTDIEIFWEKRHVAGRSELLSNPYGWKWESGKTFDLKNQEWPYIHFHSWKKSLIHFKHNLSVESKVIYISSRGFFQNNLPITQKLKGVIHGIRNRR